MAAPRTIEVEVVFASPTKQVIRKLTLAVNSTAKQAVSASGLITLFPDDQLINATVGVFGKTVPNDHILRDGDRVELYRALLQTPTEARRNRVKKSNRNKNPG